MAERFDFSFKLAHPKADFHSRQTDNEAMMRILILGDFSGSELVEEESSQQTVNKRYSIVPVDIDNFDQILLQIAPRLRIKLGPDEASAVDITFRQMEDFHPDTLFRKLELFQGLADIRERLGNPTTFAEAAEQLSSHQHTAAEGHARAGSNTKSEDDVSTLKRLLDDRSVNLEQTIELRANNVAASYIESIVARYIVPDAPPFKDVYLKAVDDALSARMRNLLHHPHFQALEASWRALEMLVKTLETGETLSLHLLDISKPALFAELSGAGEHLSGTELYRLLVEENVATFGSEPWSLLIGNYTFGSSAEDVTQLAACGALASHAGGPFIAAADAKLLGWRSLAESSDPQGWLGLKPDAKKRWDALRQSPMASWIGLALPRILLRLPYGRETEPVDQFDLVEIASIDEHEAFLWGNPAFYCALLLGQSFLERGAAMQPGDHLQVDDLPAYILSQDGGSRLLPCAEFGISDKAMEKILELGIMPFLSHRTRNIARLARFQSLSDPVSGLRGFWGS